MSGRGSSSSSSGRGRSSAGGGRGRGRGGANKRTSPSSQSSGRSRPKQPRSNVCFNFAKDGSCPRGDKCRFSHDVATMDNSGLPAPPPKIERDARIPPPIPASGFVSMQHEQPAGASAVVPTTASAGTAAVADDSRKLAHMTNMKFADLGDYISPESRRALSQVFKYEVKIILYS